MSGRLVGLPELRVEDKPVRPARKLQNPSTKSSELGQEAALRCEGSGSRCPQVLKAGLAGLLLLHSGEGSPAASDRWQYAV